MKDPTSDNLRILLVDDDEDEFILTKALLSDRSYHSSKIKHIGFELEWASTYEEALIAFEKNQHDIYLVDYHLGNRDGLELLREANILDFTAPIIFMTGFGNYEVDLEAMRVGATDYLVKAELSAPLLERTIRYALERKRTEEQIRRHASQAEMLASLSHMFVEAGLNYPQVVETIARAISTVCGEACLINMISEDRQFKSPPACYHPDSSILKTLQEIIGVQVLSLPDGLAGSVLKSGKPILISKTGGNPLYADWFNMLPMESILILPLKVQSHLIGTINMLRIHPQPSYTQNDMPFYQTLADRAALAIENARLYASEAQRVRELNALHEATAALLSTIEIDELLGKILDAAQSAIPAAERGMLYLVAPDTGRLQMRAVTGLSDPRIQTFQLPKMDDYPAKAAHDKKPQLIHDAWQGNPQPSSIEQVSEPGFRSAVIVPLILGQDVYGVISLTASQPSVFSERDLYLLETFGATTTAALRNARLHSEVIQLAITDSLTGFLNRRGLEEMGRREVERALRFDRPLSILMMDLDHFKEINDTYGHGPGDQVLQVLAERIRLSVRDVDILARYGGDEFLIILPESDLFTACGIAERIRRRVEEPIAGISEEDPLLVTASFGVSSAISETDLAVLIKRVDFAAYQAKRKGRNRIEIV
jgi:diguanylate cyclase (GGDEF)-like protein